MKIASPASASLSSDLAPSAARAHSVSFAGAGLGKAARPDALTFSGAAQQRPYPADDGVQANLERIFGEPVNPEHAFAVDAKANPKLAESANSVGVFGVILNAVRPGLADPAQADIFVQVDYADQKTVKRAKDLLEMMNNIVRPRSGIAGWGDKAALQLFRSISGVRCEMDPIEVRQDPRNPLRLGFKISMNQVPQDDLARFTSYLENDAVSLMKRFGIK